MKGKTIRLLTDHSLWIFLFIGACNTLLSWGLMLLFYEWLHLGYWGASFLAFVIASVSSYYFNRKYSFKSNETVIKSAIKFALVILICYLAAYSIAKPATYKMIDYINNEWMNNHRDQIAMIFGNIVFTSINYFGQKFFAFKRTSAKKESMSP